MFTLVLVILSIGLVAAAGISALYLTGAIFQEAGATGAAAAINSQGQQLMMAVDAFREDNDRWPTGEQELISTNYLRAQFLPIEGVQAEWVTPLDQAPVFLLRDVAASVCLELNTQLGVPTEESATPRTGTWLQCYGTDAQPHGLKVLASRSASELSKVLADPDAAALVLDTAP